MTVRKALVKLHLWVGLGAAIFVVLVSGSGAVLIFENELERVLHPKRSYVVPQGQRLPLTQIGAAVTKALPKARPGTYWFYDDPSLAMLVFTTTGQRAYVNQYTGEFLGSVGIAQTVTYPIHQFHTRLLIPNARIIRIFRSHFGGGIVGWATMALLFLAVTGLVIWFPRMIWILKPKTGWRRLNFDLHNMSGIWSLPLLVVLAATGVVMSFDFPSDWIRAIAKTPVANERPTVEWKSSVPFLDPDRILEATRNALPGAVLSGLTMPQEPDWTADVSYRFPEDRSPLGRSHVVVDPYTGEVLLAESSRTVPVFYRIRNYMRPVHTGDVFGWPSRIAMLLASLLIVLQAITGPIIWIARTYKRRRAAEP